jgi:hypothetical protein
MMTRPDTSSNTPPPKELVELPPLAATSVGVSDAPAARKGFNQEHEIQPPWLPEPEIWIVPLELMRPQPPKEDPK